MKKNKIINKYKDLVFLRKKFKNKIIGLCHGSFDILHHGHVEHILESKARVDLLFISVTGDKFIKKGPNQPYNDEFKRSKILSELKKVDYVFIDQSITAEKILASLKPNYYFKGKDYLKEDLSKNLYKEIKILKRNNGKIEFTKSKLMSSTNILNNQIDPFNNSQKKILNNLKKEFEFSDILKLIDNLNKIELNIIGEPIIDEYVYCDLVGIASKSPTLSFVKNVQENYDGGVLAIAKFLSNFVKRVNLFTYGSKINEKKIQNNIKIINLNKNLEIQKKTRLINQNRSEKITQVSNFKNRTFSEREQINIIKKLKKNKLNNLIICDYGIDLFEDKILKYINNLKINKYVNVQTNSLNFGKNIYHKYLSFFFLSLDEIEWQLSLNAKKTNLDDIKKISKKFPKSIYALTQGKNGSYIFNNNKKYYSPVFENRVLDTTGCGDAYFAIASILLMINAPKNIIPFLSNIYAGMHSLNIANKEIITKENYLKYIKSLILS